VLDDEFLVSILVLILKQAMADDMLVLEKLVSFGDELTVVVVVMSKFSV
jgi:hypothetical protein